MSDSITQAACLLSSGGVVAFPTETVYGLGADADDPLAVARIFAIKGRPADHPLIVHLSDPAQMIQWAGETAVVVLANSIYISESCCMILYSNSASGRVSDGKHFAQTGTLFLASYPVRIISD